MVEDQEVNVFSSVLLKLREEQGCSEQLLKRTVGKQTVLPRQLRQANYFAVIHDVYLR